MKTVLAERDLIRDKLIQARANLVQASHGAYVPKGYDLTNSDLDKFSSTDTQASGTGCTEDASALQAKLATLTHERETLKATLIATRANTVKALSGSYTPTGYDLSNYDLESLSDGGIPKTQSAQPAPEAEAAPPAPLRKGPSEDTGPSSENRTMQEDGTAALSENPATPAQQGAIPDKQQAPAQHQQKPSSRHVSPFFNDGNIVTLPS
ncbi:MAG: hypothetical protein LBF40_09925 [Deltaproteobacteria bacterium]|nr:hypothetical protein [Deltaproteobacteria bacterium]